MIYWKARLFAIVLILVSAALVYVNWRQLENEGTYSLKLAAFGPVCVVGGFFLLLFPQYAGKPTTTRAKILVFMVFGLGLAAGLVNVFLMDPGMFGR
jgi:hypothetical protein